MSEALRIWYLVLAAAWFTIAVRYLALYAHGDSPARVFVAMFASGLVVCLHFERFRRGR